MKKNKLSLVNLLVVSLLVLGNLILGASVLAETALEAQVASISQETVLAEEAEIPLTENEETESTTEILTSTEATTQAPEEAKPEKQRKPATSSTGTRELTKKGTAPDSVTAENDFSFSIMHTNDMHGRMAYAEGSTIGVAKLKTLKDEKNPTLMIDAGDALQGLAISNVSKGMKMAQIMSKLPYDAVAVGNHEFDFGYEQALAYKNVLPVISANVIKGGQLSFEPNRIVTKEGKRFAMIGLSTPETAVKTHPDNVKDVTFAEPLAVAREQLNSLKDQADVFVFVTHLGVDKTTPEQWRSDTLAQTLANEYPTEKIIIIDGHSHTAMPAGQVFGNVLLAQTGEHLKNVGMIEVSYQDGQPSFKAELIPAISFTNIVEDPEIKAIVAQAEADFDKEMGEVVIPNNPVFLKVTELTVGHVKRT